MSAASTPRSTRFDLPSAPASATSHTTTDSSLADWANKIRTLQRQVDADEEAEQRRLEEEIVRARLARQRRLKTGQSGDFGIGMHGINSTKLQEGSHRAASRSIESDTKIDEGKVSSPVAFPQSAVKTSAVSGEKRAPISLAEFMGGSASGPRLKRHEPQVDIGFVHDGRTEHGSVHPIFGRGGIELPGMVRRDAHTSATADGSHTSSQALSSTPSAALPRMVPSDLTRSRTTSTLTAARRYVEKLEERASSQPQTPRHTSPGLRERRISTPASSSSAELKVATPAMPTRPLSQHFSSKIVSSTTETRPKTPTVPDARKIPAMAEGRVQSPAVVDARVETSAVASQPKTPVIIEPRSREPISDFRATSAPSGSSRAKTPIQSIQSKFPILTPSGTSSFISGSVSPNFHGTPTSAVRISHPPQPQSTSAPVFLRPQTNSSKEPTPSISRLQGRGFVQSIVQATRAGTQGSPASVKSVFPSSPQAQAQTQGETRNKGARRASVLDRWPPVMNNSGTSSPTQPRASSPTRSTVSLKREEDVLDVKMHDTGRSVRSSVSMPAIPKTPLKKLDLLPGQGVDEKLGSASTMVTFINPSKAEDNPLVPGVDELGAKTSGAVGPRVGVMDHTVRSGAVVQTKTPMSPASVPLPSPGKPLSHPTKDRAKKPTRKASRFEDTRGLKQAERAAVLESPSTLNTQSIKSSVVTNTPRTPTLFPTSDSRCSRSPAMLPAGVRSGPPIPSTVSFPGIPGSAADRQTESTWSSSSLTGPLPSPGRHGMTGMVSRRALPGLTSPSAAADPQNVQAEVPKEREERTAPAKSARIPSTGNRALVMDVAQALSEVPREVSLTAPSTGLDFASSPVPTRERRKSSYERYTAMTLPPLKEEQTPLPTPVHTLSKSTNNAISKSSLNVGAMPTDPSGVRSEKRDIVHIDHEDATLPDGAVEALLMVSGASAFVPDPNLTTISVEIIDILHGSAMPIQRDNHILYDTELLVIIHRARSQESGLATTKVWCWRGRKSWCMEHEEKKIEELVRRYGTIAEVIHQQCEPPELVHVLGGKIAIRQGSRSHWSSENTTMHVIRSRNNQILIDELDLRIKNLCSGYSYCITTLDHIFVWHGVGSIPAERSAALDYAKGMATTGIAVIELVEGESDANDEMFWMIVGDPDSYAKADYWRWRNMSVPSEPRCWSVELSNKDTPVRPVPVLSAPGIVQESVYIIDCFWEFFVLVGKQARGKRSDITLAINTVMAMSKLTATSKPFLPTIHVLIMPTKLPLDMQLAFRSLDESILNDGHVPDHMNILSAQDAMEHLRTSSWEKPALRDHTMLLLGLGTSYVPLL